MLNYENPADAWYDPKNLTSWTLSGGTLSNAGRQSSTPLEGTGSMTWQYLVSLSSMNFPAITADGWQVALSGSKYTMETLIRIDSITTTGSSSYRLCSLTIGDKIEIVKPTGAGLNYHIEAGTYYGGVNAHVGPDLEIGSQYHVALVKDGTKARCFVNGIRVGAETTESATSISRSRFVVSRPLNAGAVFTTDATRLTFGVARYWDDFVPPTSFPTF